MRNIISQITALWDICRPERKNTNSTPEILPTKSSCFERTNMAPLGLFYKYRQEQSLSEFVFAN